MKIHIPFIALLTVLVITMAVSAQEISVDQLKQMMSDSSQNLTTYTYNRTADTEIMYSNQSIHKDFKAVKTIEGKIDLVGMAGSWMSRLVDETNGEVLVWNGYFVNGSEWWKEGENWTKFVLNDSAGIMQDYNEIPGQVNLIKYSDVKIVGTESFQGEEAYKLNGTPYIPICKGICGIQLLTAYSASPFPKPAVLMNGSLNIDNTTLLNNSGTVLTAWVSKKDARLLRLDINSSLTVTPQILNMDAPEFRIHSTINESTVYGDFGAPLTIELPEDAVNQSFRMKGADWRWAVFGSVRP